jgi:RNA recognition motif-containing protein
LKKIYVGNLDFGTTEDGLRNLFSSYGAIDQVTIVTDRSTGRSRGFAFVEMSNDGEAEKAIASLNGANLDGRRLNVNEARPKMEDGRGGGGRGGRPQGGGRSRGGRW